MEELGAYLEGESPTFTFSIPTLNFKEKDEGNQIVLLYDFRLFF